MYHPFTKTILVAGAAAVLCLNAHAAAPNDTAEPWPTESPARVYFGETDHSGTTPGQPDVQATVSFQRPDIPADVSLGRETSSEGPCAAALANAGTGAGMH